jgi:predicted secreted protein
MSINLPLRFGSSVAGTPSLIATARSRIGATVPSTTFVCFQCRHATLLRRPRRPYTFTQLVTLSDGSTFIHRTTSPLSVYRSNRDTRNSPLWNPSSHKLLAAEDDEAGRLAAFRARFGRGWDATSTANASSTSSEAIPEEQKTKGTLTAEEIAAAEAELQEEEDNLLDLISSFGQEQQANTGKTPKEK